MSLALPHARSEASDARTSGLLVALVVVTLFGIAAFSPAVFNDGDTWWHLTTGEWILAHHAVPRADLYSYSMPGAPWTAHEWLSEVCLALAFRAGAWSGVALMTAVAAASAALVLGLRLSRDLSGAALGVVLMLGVGLWTPTLLARPHVLVLPLAALWTVALLAARDHGTAPPLPLALLMTAWSNMHGGFIFGLVLIAPFAAEAVVAAPRGARFSAGFRWALFACVATAAALVNPFGIEALVFPFRLVALEHLSHIGEWAPQDFASPSPMEIALIALIGFALVRPMSAPPIRVAIVAALVAMTLAHTRHAQLLGLVAPMLLARPIAQAIGASAPDQAPLVQRVALAASLAGALALAGLLGACPVRRTDGPGSPIAALASVPAELRDRPVLNGYQFRRLPHLQPCAAVHRRPGRHVWRRHARALQQARRRRPGGGRGDAHPLSHRLDDLSAKRADRRLPRSPAGLAASLFRRRGGRARARRRRAAGQRRLPVGPAGRARVQSSDRMRTPRIRSVASDAAQNRPLVVDSHAPARPASRALFFVALGTSTGNVNDIRMLSDLQSAGCGLKTARNRRR